MRRAKIVCTLGPATDSYDQIKALVEAGMDVARFNLSHGTHAEHEERYHHVRKASDETGRSVGILADLQGPKIRLGHFAEGPVLLERGDTFTITVEENTEGDGHTCGTTYHGLAADVTPGEHILVDDGKVSLEVTAIDGPRVHTTVIEGGMVSDHKGLNLPGVAVSVPALSEKDEADLRWALRTGADIIALSFVRSGRDIEDVHRIMDEEGRRLPVIAKVEKPQAVDEHRRHRRRLRRHHGRPRRPRRRNAPGTGPDRPEARDQTRQAQRQTGHRRHPDARLDDRELPPHPRRGLRRGQRRHRRHGRRDALRRDQRRQAPRRNGPDDGEASSKPPRRTSSPRASHP